MAFPRPVLARVVRRACGAAWALVLCLLSQGPALASSLDLSRAVNMGPGVPFDEGAAEDAKAKEGFSSLPAGLQTLRGVPFLLMDPSKHGGNSFVVLKGRKKPDFPEGVSIPAGGLRAAYLYFLHTCRWGGTAPNVTVAEYDIVYDDGQVAAIPLRVGREFTNFFGADDTAESYLAWWHKYKNVEMGINFLPWKNPRPGHAIQSILFKSRGNMPVPILFAVTAEDHALPIPDDSPKPEKTLQTDTSKWVPLEASGSPAAGTAVDMGFLLDAPAGKHGKVRAEGDKLVFEDGTQARFWGVSLSEGNLPKAGEAQGWAGRLAALGCNAVLVEEEPAKELAAALKEKGIYLFYRPKEGDGKGAAPLKGAWTEDPAVLDADLLGMGDHFWGDGPDREGSGPHGAVPAKFNDRPMVTFPESSLPFEMSQERVFGKPYAGRWSAFWPNEYLSELPLLLAAYACQGGWSASFGMDGSLPSLGPMAPSAVLMDQPQVLLQWPAAALAYQRGDLKEGKVLVLDKDPSPLTALAHRSGLNPEGGKYRTDAGGQLKAKVTGKTRSFVSDTGQISWQGNVGVVKLESPKFQALIGFLGHRKFNNPYWAVEVQNLFASLSIISLKKQPINSSDHLLLTGVTRMENKGQTYNAAKTKILSAGKAPILVEPLAARIVLYRFAADAKLRIRALDADGQPLKTKVPAKWVKNNLVLTWIPGAYYLEISK